LGKSIAGVTRGFADPSPIRLSSSRPWGADQVGHPDSHSGASENRVNLAIEVRLQPEQRGPMSDQFPQLLHGQVGRSMPSGRRPTHPWQDGQSRSITLIVRDPSGSWRRQAWQLRSRVAFYGVWCGQRSSVGGGGGACGRGGEPPDTGEANPSVPGGMAAIYRDLVADDARTAQVISDVAAALERGRHCLVLTQWTAYVERFAEELRRRGLDPVVLRGGMNAKARRIALGRLQPPMGRSPLLVVATGPFIGEGFDCAVLDALFLAAPIAFKGRLVQYVGRVLRPHSGKTTAEVHDYHDIDTGLLASSLAKRAQGYTSLGFPDPRNQHHGVDQVAQGVRCPGSV
jgi:hypothetical protein